MKPGTGKTRTALELIQTAPVNQILWLAPRRTIDGNLQAEIALHGGSQIPIRYVGIESLSASDRIYLETRDYMSNGLTGIVCDESLKIKNYDAKRTKHILELGERAEYKLALNGTPLTRDLLDLWPQFEFLSPKILGMNLRQFKDTFCEYIRISKRFGRYAFNREFIVKYHNVDYLYSLISPYVFECDLEIDSTKQYHDWHYNLTEEEISEHNRIKEKYLDDEKMLAMNNNIFIEMTQKMQHNYCCTEEKFELLNRLTKVHPADKILVFTKFIRSREEIAKRFPKLTVLSYGMHSFGLNLQQYNATCFFDKTFDYAPREQAEYRTWRTGQVETCYFYDLTGNVGLESFIDKNIRKKKNLSDYFNEKSFKEIIKEL